MSRGLTKKQSAMQIPLGRVSKGRKNTQCESLEARSNLRSLGPSNSPQIYYLLVTTTMNLEWVFPELLLCMYTQGVSLIFFIPYVAFGNFFFFSLSNMVGTSFMPFTHLILFGCCSVLQTSVVQWFCYPFSSQRTFRLFPISCPHITAAIKVLGQAPGVCMQGFLRCVCVGGGCYLFCTALELRIVFIFFKGCKNI